MATKFGPVEVWTMARAAFGWHKLALGDTRHGTSLGHEFAPGVDVCNVRGDGIRPIGSAVGMDHAIAETRPRPV